MKSTQTRVEYTFTFRGAPQDTPVRFSDKVFADASPAAEQGSGLLLDASSSVSVWAAPTGLTAFATRPDGSLAELIATPSTPSVTDNGTDPAKLAPGPLRGQYHAASQSVNSGSFVGLPWVENDDVRQDSLLDLTDPLNPTVITGGVYTVSVAVGAGSGVTAGKSAYVELDLDNLGDDAIVWSAIDLGLANRAAALSLTYYVPAGGVFFVGVIHDVGSATIFQMSAAVVQLSADS